MCIRDSVANVDTTAGGVDAEDDGHLRERIMLAPEAFSVAGSELAYRYHALSASPDIVDVGVLSPAPGEVDLYLLAQNGLPGEVQLVLVATYVSGEKIRPLTDVVHVYAALRVPARLEAELTLYVWADEVAVRALVDQAVASWLESGRTKLGVDIVRTQLVALLSVYGVYRVHLVAPESDREIDASQWVDWEEIRITIMPERKNG